MGKEDEGEERQGRASFSACSGTRDPGVPREARSVVSQWWVDGWLGRGSGLGHT